MSELRIVLIKHGPHELQSEDTPDEETELTAVGRDRTQNLATVLRRRGVILDHCFTSWHRHSRETADILVRSVGHPRAQIVEVEALTPGTPEQSFTIENIHDQADSKGIELNRDCTVALVGHELRLSKLISRMTGKRFEELDHLEAICLAGEDLQDFRNGRAEWLWRISDSARQNEYLRGTIGSKMDVDAELRGKISSKMTVAILLAGFSFAGLAELLTGNPLPTLEELRGLPPITTFAAVLPWLAVVFFTAASALFIAAAYLYDRLAMPRRFWEQSDADDPENLPPYVRNKMRDYGVVYPYMVRTWTHVFTPGVFLSALGFLALVVHAASVELGVLCTIVLITVALYYWRVRPRLGVD
jgi:phosphohistidine phosphatase SixA